MKLDLENRLFISLEGNTICGKSKNYTTDITFVCNRNVSFKIKLTFLVIKLLIDYNS